jgi:hypothetical protein
MSECNDPDHGAINAERQETIGLRRAWIELDDKRQYVEKQLQEVTKQRDALADALRNYMSHHRRHGFVTYNEALDAEQALAAVKGGSHARD